MRATIQRIFAPIFSDAIWHHEGRQRRRDRRALIAPGLFAALSSLGVWWLFWALSNQPDLSVWQARRAFSALTLLFLAAGMLLTPSFSAPSIAGERESGLLEALQLSHLTPSDIVRGKWLSTLSMALRAFAVTIPAQSAALWLPGISPLRLLAALGVQIIGITTACTLGLFCSAWSRRANLAMRAAFTFLLMWLVVSINCWSMATAGRTFIVPVRVPLSAPVDTLFAAIGLSNPLLAASLHWEPWRYAWLRGSHFDWVLNEPVLSLNLLGQLLLIALLLHSSARALRRPFTQAHWIEAPGSANSTSVGLELSAPKTRGAGREGLGWWELPLTGRAHFDNPILQREFRGKFRMRAVPTLAIVIEAILGTVVGYFYLRAWWWSLFDAPSRPLIWWSLSLIGLLVLMMATLVMAASAFSREREAGTWPGIALSLLSAREIVGGKIGAIVGACVAFSAPFWPVLIPCIRGLSPTGGAGIAPMDAFATGCLLGATALCNSTWGLLLSWRCRKTATSTLIALGTLFVLDIFVPVAAGALPGATEIVETNRFYNPSLALLRAVAAGGRGGPIAEELWPCVAVQMIFALLCWLATWALVHRQRAAR